MEMFSDLNLSKAAFLSIAVVFVFVILMGNIQAENLNSHKTMTARTLGMGGAFTGVADDPAAVIYNPAGLVESEAAGILISGGAQADNPADFSELLDVGEDFQDLPQQSPQEILDDLPARVNAAGQGAGVISLGSSALGGDLRADMKGHTSTDELTADLNYESDTNLRLGLSSDIVRIPAEVGTAAYGINLRYNSRNTGGYQIFEENNSMYRRREEKSGAGLAFDGGLLLQMTPLVHMGVMVENIWAQEFEMTGEKETYEYDVVDDNWEKDDERSDSSLIEPVNPARQGRIGIAARIPGIKTTVAADLENAPILSETDDDPVLFLGAENEMIFDSIRLRACTYSYSERVFTAGAGLKLPALTADIGAGHSPGGDFTSVIAQVKLGF